MTKTDNVLDGAAIVFCAGAFGTPEGKTAHGLVRFTERYNVLCVVDPKHAGKKASDVIDGVTKEIPVYESVRAALNAAPGAEYLVIGLAPDGGRLPQSAKSEIGVAIAAGLNVDSGLHDFLGDDPEFCAEAKKRGVTLRDIRRTPSRSDLHFFTGDIQDVAAKKIAVLGSDSAIGKRTTAWILVHALRAANQKAELVGTGQTAWLQGARWSLVMDSLINDFVSGEIEHAVVSAWREAKPDVIVVEGQGSLMNPAYPGGFEILAAARPDGVILQHAPKRKDYDGFPGYPIHPLKRQIEAIQVVSDRPVVAITLNHEGMSAGEIHPACEAIQQETGLPAYDVLAHGAAELATLVASS